jgi:hypothetical protein
MIPFIERTWFLWWLVAVMVILRWFHLFSTRTDEEAFEVRASGGPGCKQAIRSQKELPAHTIPSEGVGWCREGESNPHRAFAPADFKSAASANFAIPARDYSSVAMRPGDGPVARNTDSGRFMRARR